MSKEKDKNKKTLSEKEINQIIEERDKYLDEVKRAKAETINEKRILEEKCRKERNKGILECISTIIPTLDSFDLALEHKDDSEEWEKGIEQIKSQLEKALKDYDVEVVTPLGETFNPEMHQSVAVVEVDDESKDEKIVEVLQKGYKRKDIIIRPAVVITSKYKK